jgi:hypothetical protein
MDNQNYVDEDQHQQQLQGGGAASQANPQSKQFGVDAKKQA